VTPPPIKALGVGGGWPSLSRARQDGADLKGELEALAARGRGE
jgi:hypothetical protein